MKIAVIEDDEMIVKKVYDILSLKYKKKYINTFSTTKEYEEYIKINGIFDVLLIDTELKDENGIEYIKYRHQRNTYVLFVSSNMKFIFEAFDINVLGFMIKNQLDFRLIEKMCFIEERLMRMKTYLLRTKFGNIWVLEEDIVYFHFEYASVYVSLYKQTFPILTTYSTLKCIKVELSESFFKINRNTIINLHKIKKINYELHEILLSDESKYIVSRRIWKEFLDNYNKVICFYE